MTEQLIWLAVLALPVDCLSWTVTHEAVFREPSVTARKSRSAVPQRVSGPGPYVPQRELLPCAFELLRFSPSLPRSW